MARSFLFRIAAFGVLLPSVAPGIASASVTGSLALTSDYVWRGSSQTAGDPALQGSLKWTTTRGFYAQVWGSNVEFASAASATSEFDANIGWAGTFASEWAWDANLTHYRYPAAGVDLNWTELNGTLTYASNYAVALAWSDEALGVDGDGLNLLASAKFPLSERFRFEGGIGHYLLDDPNGDGQDDDHSYGLISAVWVVPVQSGAPALEARVSVHDTDQHAETLFGHSLTGSRVEAALSVNF